MDEFEDMTYDEINLAIEASDMTTENINWIWERQYKPFEVH
jgi:hypothetical protein